MRLTYAHRQPVLGIGLSGQVSVREEQYPDYIVGVLDVPGGRYDRAWAAWLTMAFETLDYAEFIPEVSVTFGIKSAF